MKVSFLLFFLAIPIVFSAPLLETSTSISADIQGTQQSSGGGGGGCTSQWNCTTLEECQENGKLTQQCIDTNCGRTSIIQEIDCIYISSNITEQISPEEPKQDINEETQDETLAEGQEKSEDKPKSGIIEKIENITESATFKQTVKRAILLPLIILVAIVWLGVILELRKKEE